MQEDNKNKVGEENNSNGDLCEQTPLREITLFHGLQLNR